MMPAIAFMKRTESLFSRSLKLRHVHVRTNRMLYPVRKKT